MSALETIESFITLFDGRTDAYGAWSGGMVSCTVNPQDRQPIQDHLDDGPYIGVYPVTDDNTTGWGCIDLDGKDHLVALDEEMGVAQPYDWTLMWRIATELQDVLAYKEVTSWIERTANGIHLWVFAEERVAAETMRHALLVACQVAQYKPKEVNPKQTSVSAEKPLGNYVRLPYYGALKLDSDDMPRDRFVVDEDGRPLSVREFSRLAMASRTPVSKLEAMSTMYAPPASAGTSSVSVDAATDEAFRMLEPILPPVVAMIFADGPLGDRSNAMVKVALILRDGGWTPQSTFVVLKALDERLGKFVGRPDQDERLLDIISKVAL